MPTDAALRETPPNSLLSGPWSPTIDYAEIAFRGMRIAAPSKVFASDEPLELVIAGSYQFDAEELVAGLIYDGLLLVAVDRQRQQVFSGRFNYADNEMPLPDGVEPLEVAGIITSYFNPDLADALELPQRSAEYIVYASYRQYLSNVVTVEVKITEDP